MIENRNKNGDIDKLMIRLLKYIDTKYDTCIKKEIICLIKAAYKAV